MLDTFLPLASGWPQVCRCFASKLKSIVLLASTFEVEASSEQYTRSFITCPPMVRLR